MGRNHTVLVEANIHHSGRKTQEKNTVLLVLTAVLGRYHVHGRLGCRVQRSRRQIILVRPLHVSEAAGQDNDLLGVAFEDERQEEIEKVNIGNDIDMEQLFQGVLKLLGAITPSFRAMSVFVVIKSARETYKVPMGSYASNSEMRPALAMR
jgi:hypothetical protein